VEDKYRKSGIGTIADIPWGTHICQLYQTKGDLLDVLIPYFKAGLKNNDFCMWVTSEPLGVKEAEASLRKAVKNLDRYIEKGQIEILDYSEWYTKSGKFNAGEVLQGWVEKEGKALEKSFDGIRATGNTSWLGDEDWVAFSEYEAIMDSIIGEHRMITMCTYSLDRCGTSELLDVMNNHEVNLVKRNGAWKTIESDERKRLKKILTASEVRFRRLFETAKDGILILDADTGQIMDSNPFIEGLLGYTAEEMLGNSLWEIGLLKDIAKSEDAFKKLQKEGYIRYEDLKLETKDGKSVDVEFISNVYDVDKKKIIQCNIREISKRKAVEEISEQYKEQLEELVKQRTSELEESNRKLLQELTERKQAEEELRLRVEMLDQASDGIMLRDFDGNLLYANETALKDRGYSREEFFKLNARDLVVIEPDAGKIEEWWQEILEQGYRHTEYNVQCKDGSVVPMDVMATKIKSGDKEYILSITRNITEQKHMEVERKELERKAQVASRLASVGEMASGIAHEINNPLTGVVGFAQLLAEREDLPEDVREELKIIHEGGERVAKIIKGLLSFARQSKPKREYISINEVVEEVIKLRQYELKTSNIEVINRFDPELPWTMADSGQLQQIFINLVVNAEQEMSRAHGKGRLEIKTELAGDMIHISFKDDGPGIAKEHIERIFDPFFTTKEVGKGTGLGLSLSHGIIAEHGGRLYAESEPGKGATFVVELPVLAEEADVEETKAANETGKVIKGRILVVDDEEVVRQYLNSVLTKMGHTVDLATDGEKALELVKSTGYNLILSDMKMPGMDGKEFYRKVEEINPPLTGRLVFITGDVMGEDTRDFIRKTGAPYITKPFNAEQLHGLVNDIIGGSMK